MKRFEDIKKEFFDTNNIFLVELMEEFFSLNPVKYFLNRQFFKEFLASLPNANTINSLALFNVDTFESQYDLFSNILNGKFLPVLREFYIFILGKPEGKDLITYLDGIDRVMISRTDFFRIYNEGFRLVAFNPLEPFPQHDKWLVMPNGFEYQSTELHAKKYTCLNISNLEYQDYNFFLKEWFWEETCALKHRISETRTIIAFLNFLFKLRNENMSQHITKNFNHFYISGEEIFAYKNLVIGEISNSLTRNSYIYPVTKFLRFLKEKSYAEVDPSVFVLLKHRYRITPKGGQDIPDNHLKLLADRLKKKATISYLNTLYFTIFHIALTTQFRISHIVNLQLDCVKETMKDNQYVLASTTKVSKGEIVTTPISAYTKRHIDDIKKFTNQIRLECNDDYFKKFLFVFHSRANIYSIVNANTFTEYLGDTCAEIGLPRYGANNLRDTYMTKSKEYILREGKSLVEMEALTNHKSIDTTNNNYVNEKLRDYLEVTHSVIIGNVDIKGIIVNKLDTPIPDENIVDDECGYCEKSCCDSYSNLDCPMCSGFVVTLDRIPYYEKKIMSLDTKIANEKIVHEKEHLLTIKRLYIAYLERLYVLKEEVEHNEFSN